MRFPIALCIILLGTACGEPTGEDFSFPDAEYKRVESGHVIHELTAIGEVVTATDNVSGESNSHRRLPGELTFENSALQVYQSEPQASDATLTHRIEITRHGATVVVLRLDANNIVHDDTRVMLEHIEQAYQDLLAGRR